MTTRESVITDALYTTRQAAAALGLSHRCVDGAVRQLGFEPTVGGRGSGRPRRWSLADILALKIGRCWMRRGASWLAVRSAVRWIQTAGVKSMQECPVVVLHGDRVWATSSSEELIDVMFENSPKSGTAIPCYWKSCLDKIECSLAALLSTQTVTDQTDGSRWLPPQGQCIPDASDQPHCPALFGACEPCRAQ